MKILFICTGNKFRSPTAHHILKTLCPNLEVKSAGTAKNADKNHLIAKKMRRCLVEMGYESPSIRSQHVTEELLQWADLVYFVAPTHRKYLEANYPKYIAKCHALYELYELSIKRIEDPAFIQKHEEVLDVTKIIEFCVKQLIKRLNY